MIKNDNNKLFLSVALCASSVALCETKIFCETKNILRKNDITQRYTEKHRDTQRVPRNQLTTNH